MPSAHLDDTQRLLAFNQLLIEHALALVEAHVGTGRPRYAGVAGSHLRHLIEHYEALLLPVHAEVVDYDARARDAELEVCPQVARARLQALHHKLGMCSPRRLEAALQVRGQGGMVGEFSFLVASSLGRELAFMASHTVHHFALLADYCKQQGIATPDGFGKAPATRAHELANRAAA